MLTIGKYQMDALSNAAFEDFIRRMIVYVRLNFEDNREDDAAVEVQVRQVTKMAQDWEMEMEQDIEFLIHLWFLHEPFRKDPFGAEIVDIMTFPDREAERKPELLFYYLDRVGSDVNF